MQKKWVIIAVIVLISAGLLAWLFLQSINPATISLPGEKVEDLGREHVGEISTITYNSNPPTSGTHFPVWAKRGVYPQVLSDGYLIHSLEHGFIILSYNCDYKVTFQSHPKLDLGSINNYWYGFLIKAGMTVTEAFAHEGEPVEIHDVATGSAQPLMQMKFDTSSGMSFFTPENAPTAEVTLSEEFNLDSCKELVSKLSGFLNDFDRVIVVPRPTLDNKIALTAWNRVEKLNSFDKEKIEAFIKAYHNKGPEKTVE